QLVADAGHELRTPLTSLRTNLDLLVQTTSRGGLSDQDREELLADVRAQSEELTALVQDIVELARDDPAAAQVEELDFAEICERAIDRVKRRAPGLTFEVKLAPWVVRGDATALERAVANILDNAAKWSPAGATVQVRLDGGGGDICSSSTRSRVYRGPTCHTCSSASTAPPMPAGCLAPGSGWRSSSRSPTGMVARSKQPGPTPAERRAPFVSPLPLAPEPSRRLLGPFSGSSQDAGRL